MLTESTLGWIEAHEMLVNKTLLTFVENIKNDLELLILARAVTSRFVFIVIVFVVVNVAVSVVEVGIVVNVLN